MKVKLLQRWGNNQPGDTVDVDDTTGRWLVGISRGTAPGERFPNQEAAAPGSDGPDPLAGGDPTRRHGLKTVKTERRDNHALPVDGSPVQYNAGVRAEPAGEDGPPASGTRPARDSSKPSSTGRRKSTD